MSEHDEQVAVCQYLDLLKIVYCAVPNGGQRHKAVAVKLKMEGVKAGVPDLLLFTPAGGYRGIAIEMKDVKSGRLSTYQKKWKEDLESCGWLSVVCHGADEAIKVIKQLYLEGRIDGANNDDSRNEQGANRPH